LNLLNSLLSYYSHTKDQQALQIKKKNEEEVRLNALEEAKQKEIEDALRKVNFKVIWQISKKFIH
jgi:hypothetical protein